MNESNLRSIEGWEDDMEGDFTMEELVAENTRGRSYGWDCSISKRDEEFENDFIGEDNKGDNGEDDIVVLDEVVSPDEPTQMKLKTWKRKKPLNKMLT